MGSGGGGSTGAIVGGVVGGIIGAIVPGASIYTVALGVSIGSTVGGIAGSIIAPIGQRDPDLSPPSGINDLYVTSAALGTMIPLVYGGFRITGNIIDATRKYFIDRTVTETVPTSGGGKKAPDNTVTNLIRTYFIDLDIALCEGPISHVSRIWLDQDLWYDESLEQGRIKSSSQNSDVFVFSGIVPEDGSPPAVNSLTVYLGTDTQPPDATFEVEHGVGTVPSYKGVAHVVFDGLNLGASGRVPNFTFEVIVDDTYLDSLQDFTVVNSGDNAEPGGVFAIFAKGLKSRSVVNIEVLCNVNFEIDSMFTIITRAEAGSFLEEGFGLGAIEIAGFAGGTGDGRHTARTVNASTITIEGLIIGSVDNPPDPITAITLTLSQSVQTPNALGTVRSYSLKFLGRISQRNVGVNPQSVAHTGETGDLITGVINYGSGDGLDPTTDVVYFFRKSSRLDTSVLFQDATPITEEPYTRLSLRTGTEVTNNVTLGSNQIIGVVPGARFFITHTLDNSISRIIMSTYNVSRISLSAMPISMVMNAVPDLFILCDGNVVKKISANGALSVTDTITLNAGASSGRLYAASDSRIWASNTFDDTVSHFTTSGNKVDVPVSFGPLTITEASDGFIWVACNSDFSLHRIDPVDDSVETFMIDRSISHLTPGLNGKVWASTSGTLSLLLLVDTDGTFIEFRTSIGITKLLSDINGYAYAMNSEQRTLIAVSPDGANIRSIESTGGLSSVVRDIIVRTGLEPSRICTSGLDNTPVNMVISEVQSARDIVESLANTFSFNGVESEGGLKFFYLQDSNIMATIPENALSGGQNEQNKNSLIISRVQERELPTSVTVTAPDIARSYSDGSVEARLITSPIENNPTVLRLPYALTFQQINRVANAHLYGPRARRERAELTCTPFLRLLEPGDGVSVTARGNIYNLRIAEKTSGRNWVDNLRLESQDTAVFSEIEDAVSPQERYFRQRIPSPVDVLIVEPPSLTSDTTARYYSGFYKTSATRSFTGAGLYQSLDGGTSYTTVNYSDIQATTGTVAVPLSSVNPNVWDDTNVVTVVLRGGTLTTVSELAVLNGSNRAMIGSELIQFMTATLVAANTYELSHLLRGRKGTESFVGTHIADEDFILLNAVVLDRPATYAVGIINMAEYYKVVTALTELADATAFLHTLDGTSIKPWAPVLQPPVRNTPAANDITFNWVARSRLYDVPIGVDLPWDTDASKVFNVYIYEDGTYAAVARTITTPAATGGMSETISQVYTAAQQTADFGSPQSTIYYGIQATGFTPGYESRSSG